jgi:hypothetical protein
VLRHVALLRPKRFRQLSLRERPRAIIVEEVPG